MLVPIEISARHLHLSQADLEQLFGVGYQLTVRQMISQPTQFAASETVELIGPKGSTSARIIGPVREHTQVELSSTECRLLGITAPLRLSGHLDGSSSLKLVGPAGELTITEGVIISHRHLHITTSEAERNNLSNNQVVQIKISGPRGGILDQVIVRATNNSQLALHLDTDEANALGITPDNNFGELII